jgi:DNA-binding CsgD family transcriptional regulator
VQLGIVDFTANGSMPSPHVVGDVAWRSRWTDLDTWLRSAPVDAVVFEVDLDEHPELIQTLSRVRASNPRARLVLSGNSRTGALTAEVASVTVHRSAAHEVPLSNREVQVLGAIRAGRTNREIAGMLGISLSTVNKHVENILRKLSARNRAQAAAGAAAASVRHADQPTGGAHRSREVLADG